MFRSIFRASWAQHFKLWLGLVFGLFLFELLMAGIYESTTGYLSGSVFGPQELPDLFKAFTGGGSNMFEPLGWLGLGYTHPVPIILFISWTIVLSSAAIAKEVETGTGEMLFSRPVDRRLLLLARMMVWFTGLLLIIVAGILGTLAGKNLGGGLESISIGDTIELGAAILPLLFVVAGLGYFATALFSQRAKASAIATWFAVASYFLNFASYLWEPLKEWGQLSVFNHAVPAEWADNGVNWGPTGIMLVIGMALMAIGIIIVNSRDIAD
ncbi:MAG: ABC transporter permease subunit [Candidatus Saccharimonadales bacterium]|nr:ABC transporter permease subunit [Candidatus Saccharimonadales bacterium]